MYDDQNRIPDAAILPDHANDRRRLSDPPDRDSGGACGSARAHSEIFWVKEPESGMRIYIDPAADTVWGVDVETFLADPEALIRSVHPDDREAFEALLDGRQDDMSEPLECRIILRGSTTRWIEARSFPVRDKDARITYTFGVISDTTGEKRTAVARKSAAEQRADFLSIASHELRTPLQPISGYLYLMLDNPGCFGLTAEGIHYLSVVQECANRMCEVINRILTVSLIDTELKIVQPHWEAVSLEKLVADVVRACSAGDSMTYAIEIPPGRTIETDWQYLYEALSEICINVMKHLSPPRHVVFRYAEEHGAHVLSVSDNGPGMDEITRKKLFQPFSIGGKDKLSRACGRLGLGLAIAKKDVEILGGTISADSTLCQGSTFTIRLPKQHA
jgi:signal transduction histidine kinase